MMLIYFFTAAVLSNYSVAAMYCTYCNLEECEKVNCTTRVIPDVCNCCERCSRALGETCHGQYDYLGSCDALLECFIPDSDEPDPCLNGEGTCMTRKALFDLITQNMQTTGETGHRCGTATLSCGACKKTACEIVNCTTTVIKDPCQCCDRCSPSMDEKCNGPYNWYGDCDIGFECENPPSEDEGPYYQRAGVCVRERRALGEYCDHPRGLFGQCYKGLECYISPGNNRYSDVQQVGVCVRPKRALGEKCDNPLGVYGECLSGLECSMPPSSGVDRKVRTCSRVKRELGEKCDRPYGEFGACNQGLECHVVPSEETTLVLRDVGICITKKRALGDSCDGPGQCEMGLECSRASDSTSSPGDKKKDFCVRPQRAEGEKCDDPLGLHGPCRDGLECYIQSSKQADETLQKVGICTKPKRKSFFDRLFGKK